MHDGVVWCETDLSLVDQLSILTDEVDEIWSQFTIDIFGSKIIVFY